MAALERGAGEADAADGARQDKAPPLIRGVLPTEQTKTLPGQMMADEKRLEPQVLEELLQMNRNAPGFRDTLRGMLGEVKEWEDDGDVFFTSALAGVQILTDASGRVTAAFLFGPGSTETSEYRGIIPAGLNFRLSRDEVRSLLGTPDEAAEAEVRLGDLVSPWDKYHLGGVWLHARYALDGSHIDRVTLMPRAAEALHQTSAAWQDEAALAGERQRWMDPGR